MTDSSSSQGTKVEGGSSRSSPTPRSPKPPTKLASSLVLETIERLDERGLLPHDTSGNISAAYTTPDGSIKRASVTSAGRRLRTLYAGALCSIEFAEQGWGLLPTSEHQPTSEIELHLAAHRLHNPTIVAHTHSPNVTALSCERPSHVHLEPFHYYQALIAKYAIPIIPFATPSTAKLADDFTVFSRAHKSKCAILANHGAIAWGETPSEVADTLTILDDICRIRLQLNHPVHLTPVELAEVAKETFGIEWN